MEQKLICFDLDGTLTPSSTWELLNFSLGVTPDEDLHLFNLYKEGKLEYEMWMKELVKIYKENSLVTREKIRELTNQIIFREGLEDVLADAKAKGYITLLMSGSVDVIVQEVAERFGFDYMLACNELQFNDKDELVDIISMGDESSAKLKLLSKFCEENNIDLESVIAVGNGGNEKDVFIKTKGVLLGENETLESLAWKKISELTEVKSLI